MNTGIKYKSMLLLLPLLAACSGEGGQQGGVTASAAVAAEQLDTAVTAQGLSTTATTAAQPAQSATGFDAWAQRLMADRLSPVTPAGADLSQAWVGVDGRVANVVVRVPRTAGKPTVTIKAPAANADATPLFTAALATLKRQGGGTLQVAPGDYHFKTTSADRPGTAHMLLYGLSDVDIRAKGANFLFETNAYGIFVQDCERVRIYGATLRDPRQQSGTGQMRMVDGKLALVLDQPLPAGAAINWVQPMDQGKRSWPETMNRTIITPGSKQPTRLDDRTFVIPEFVNLKKWGAVSVKYTWYQANAVYVRDSYTGVTNDVVLESIRIGSHGGGGVLLRSRGRGFAMINSTIAADDGRPYSTNYDGLHVAASSGDILVRGNSFANTGDDLMNLRSVIHKVAPVSANVATISNEGRNIRQGDEIAFFSAAGDYLGTRIVSVAPPLGASDTVTFTFADGPSIANAAFARSINMTPRRFAVVNNTLADSGGHGMLIQIPIGLVQNNVIANLPRAAIKLLTSFDPWMEGSGAFNVRVTGNTIDKGTGETYLSYPTGIISSWGEVTATKIPTNMFNGWIRVDNNKFTNPRAACVVAYNTKAFTQDNNTCGG